MRLAMLLTACLMGAACTSAGPGGHSTMEIRAFRERPPPTEEVLRGWASQFTAGSFTSRNGMTIPYRILGHPAGSAPLPLVFVLHGSGAMGTNNRSQLGPFGASWANVAGRAIVVVPQVASRSANYRRGKDGLPESMPGPSFVALLELIDARMADAGVDRARVHLVGFSMGGSAALQVALHRPGSFASVVSFSPVPPPRSQATALARQELTLVHGDADTENPFAADAAWVEALRGAGGQPHFVVYRGMGHQVPDDMLHAADWRLAMTAAKP